MHLFSFRKLFCDFNILYHDITLTPPLPIHLGPPNPKLVPTPLHTFPYFSVISAVTQEHLPLLAIVLAAVGVLVLMQVIA